MQLQSKGNDGAPVFQRLRYFADNVFEAYEKIMVPAEILSSEQNSNLEHLLAIHIQSIANPLVINKLAPILACYYQPFVDGAILLQIAENDRNAFQVFFQKLAFMKVRNSLEKSMMEFVLSRIDKFVDENYSQDRRMIAYGMEVLHGKFEPILKTLFDESAFSNHKRALEVHMYRKIGELLFSNVFDIIRDYPDSTDSLEDLKLCIDQSGEHEALVVSICNSIKERLLIIDARTSAILDIYKLCQKCIMFLTPIKAHHERVLNPIQKYLRTRKDVTREIIMQIISPDEELQKTEMELLLRIHSEKSKYSKEFHKMLSDQLLSINDFQAEDQIRQVEVLQDLLGEHELSTSRVMMKDFGDSRRLTNKYSSSADGEIEFSALIISQYFWPKMGDSTLELPPIVKSWMENYSAAFEEAKSSRELNWLNHLGIVDLTVELDGKCPLQFQVTPTQASLLFVIQEKGKAEFELLEQILKLKKEEVRDAARFWHENEIMSIFGSLVISNDHPEIAVYKGNEKEVDEGADLDDSENTTKDLEAVWPMLQGMLTNLGALSAETIHQTLGMFSSDAFNYNLKLNDLQIQLEAFVVKDKLEFDGTKYKVKRI